MLKDSWFTRTTFDRVAAHELLHSLKESSFACAFYSGKLWHQKNELLRYTYNVSSSYDMPWDQSGHGKAAAFPAIKRPYGQWWHSLKISRGMHQKSFWPVCYGGGFGTTRTAILQVPKSGWSRIEYSLSRGDNIEESHYMERSWAALLTPPLQPTEARVLECATRDAPLSNASWFRGAYEACHCFSISRCRQAGTEAIGDGTRVPPTISSLIAGSTGDDHRRPGFSLRVAVYMQVHSNDTTALDELCDCVGTVASVPVKKLAVHVSFAGDGLHYASGPLKDARAKFHVLHMANAGADVKPFIKQLQDTNALNASFDLILKVHTKSDHVWRQHTLSSLCGSQEHVHAIYTAFEERRGSLGVVAPQGTIFDAATPIATVWSHIRSRYFSGQSNLASAFDAKTVRRMRKLNDLLSPGLSPINRTAIAAGTAFWMRAAALRIPSWVHLLTLDRTAAPTSWIRFTAEYQVAVYVGRPRLATRQITCVVSMLRDSPIQLSN